MDVGLLQVAAYVVLGWIVVAVATTIALAAFMRGAHLHEHALPTDDAGIADWIQSDEPLFALKARRRAQARSQSQSRSAS
jgi:hypothetical protein